MLDEEPRVSATKPLPPSPLLISSQTTEEFHNKPTTSLATDTTLQAGRSAHNENHKSAKGNSSVKSFDSGEFVCPECEFSASSKDGFVKHLKLHVIATEPSCPLCKKKFPRSTRVHAHLPSCEMIWIHAGGMRQHVDHSYTEKADLISIKYVTTSEELRTDIEKPPPNYSDEQRRQTISVDDSQGVEFTLLELANHGRPTNTDYQQPLNISDLGAVQGPPFTCAECGKGFQRLKNLKAHMVVHAGVKEFACTICNKSFLRNHRLKLHMKLHETTLNNDLLATAKSPLKCPICSIEFVDFDAFTAHVFAKYASGKVATPVSGQS